MICVDANVVVALLVHNTNTTLAEALIATQRRAVEAVVAVDLLGYELTNAFHRQVRLGALSLDEARASLVRLPSVGIELHPAANLHDRALVIASETGQGTSYDAHYVALAEALACDLWTADQKLVNAMQPRYPFVHWLGDFGNA